jgi:hypothetical protein
MRQTVLSVFTACTMLSAATIGVPAAAEAQTVVIINGNQPYYPPYPYYGAGYGYGGYYGAGYGYGGHYGAGYGYGGYYGGYYPAYGYGYRRPYWGW